MTTMNITLPEQMRDFVDEQVQTGNYGTASEYVRSLIREDRRRKEQERLEQLILDGLDSGDAEEVSDDFWNDLRQRVRSRRQLGVANRSA